MKVSKALEDWKNKGEYFAFEKHAVFYKKEGKGDSILLLHGFPTSSWDWVKIWDVLKIKNQLIAPDFLGFGFSDKPRNMYYTIELQADIVESLLKSRGVSSFHILAHDYGDTVAQELLHRSQTKKDYPFVIKSVFLLNGGIFPESIQPLRIQKLLSGPFGFIISALTNEFIIRKRFSSIFAKDKKPTDIEWKDFWTIINYNKGKNISYKLSDYMNQRIRHQKKWSDSLVKCEPPMQLVIGTEDSISGINIANTFRQRIENADVILLNDVGHYPQVEADQTIIGVYTKFLSSL